MEAAAAAQDDDVEVVTETIPEPPAAATRPKRGSVKKEVFDAPHPVLVKKEVVSEVAATSSRRTTRKRARTVKKEPVVPDDVHCDFSNSEVRDCPPYARLVAIAQNVRRAYLPLQRAPHARPCARGRPPDWYWGRGKVVEAHAVFGATIRCG